MIPHLGALLDAKVVAEEAEENLPLSIRLRIRHSLPLIVLRVSFQRLQVRGLVRF